MKSRNLIIVILGLFTSGAALGDASVMKPDVLDQNLNVGPEIVELRQVGNVVENKVPWRGEDGLTIKYDLGEPTLAERMTDKRKTSIITETTDFGDGGFKIDIILNEKPNTNTFCYQIEGYQNYNFFYQPPLTQEAINNGDQRPEEIVGSYAVYHKTLKDHKIGNPNYATGKVMHIPFPYVWEVNDETTKQRAENMTYEDGELCVVVQQAFLNNAEYPVRVDPTFGNTVAGASCRASEDDVLGHVATSPTSDTTTMISAYLDESSTNNEHTVKTGLYQASDASLVGETSARNDITTTPAWYDFTLTESITAQDYIIASYGDSGAGFLCQYYDTGVEGDGEDDVNSGYPTFPDPGGFVTNDRKYSLYVTYGGAGGGDTTETSLLQNINHGTIDIGHGTLNIQN